MGYKKYLFLIGLVLPLSLFSATFTEIKLRVDTASYTRTHNSIIVDGQSAIYFYFDDNKEVMEVNCLFDPLHPIESAFLIPSGDYQMVDSMLIFQDRLRFKIRFINLTSSDFLNFHLQLKRDTLRWIEEINLQPLTRTSVELRPENDELYIGEEKSFEVFTNNSANLNVSNEWKSGYMYEYRFTRREGNVYLNLVPNQLGSIDVLVPVATRKPYLNEKGKLIYQLDSLHQHFYVKASRLRFLQIDQKELTLSDASKLEGILVELENTRALELNKTYRIENQEEPGGALIAELFTKSLLANNKVMCIVRPYNYHRKSNGYLYIKDGDNARFITNFSITPETSIEKISVLQEGRDWKVTRNVHPGETIDLKLEGTGLHKANFQFEGLTNISRDTIMKSENEALFKLIVPIDISKKRLNILNHGQPTGQFLNVEEYQKPREFDYMFINYGDMNRMVSAIRGPILYQKTVRDITLEFNNTRIDEGELHGKQYLEVDVQVMNRKNELIEMRTIKNIAVCPSAKSPRYDYYPSGDCLNGSVSLNKYLRKKTYDLEQWSRIGLTVRNADQKYKEDGYEKEIDIILKRRYSFDIEVSFPAGLITVTKHDTGGVNLGSLSGISMAMIAQFSFYHPDKIAQYRPYKIGAGFLALNAFNFTETADRDVGLVVLGSIYPTTKDVKLTFPLYMGFGYFIKESKFFFLVGPGIRIRL